MRRAGSGSRVQAGRRAGAGRGWPARAGLAILAAAACGEPGPPGGDAPARASAEGIVLAGGIAPPAFPEGALANPFAAAAASAAEGERIYSAMNCDGCHGGGGVGIVGPSLADGRWRYGGGDRDVFRSVFEGRPRGMPAYGGILPAEAIWKVVTYLRSLAPPATVPTQSWE